MNNEFWQPRKQTQSMHLLAWCHGAIASRYRTTSQQPTAALVQRRADCHLVCPSRYVVSNHHYGVEEPGPPAATRASLHARGSRKRKDGLIRDPETVQRAGDPGWSFISGTHYFVHH